MLQNATTLRKSAPGPPNISDEHVSCTAPRKMNLCRSSSNAPRLPSFLEMLQNPHVLLTFDKVHNPLRLPRETTSERPKVVRTPGVFNVLTSKCASRHNGMHFFNISTSKSKNRKTHWYEAVSSALNFPFLKEVSQNCFVFDVVNFKK